MERMEGRKLDMGRKVVLEKEDNCFEVKDGGTS